ncbi:MAG: hypothetical protein HQL45_14430 [Alphaproteobacteria bacterium]|nr:hypothetical protein [Alphaproteobacteria bacterium]
MTKKTGKPRGKISKGRLSDRPESQGLAKAIFAQPGQFVPKKPEELTSCLIRIRTSTLDFIEAEGKKIGLSRTEWIRMACENIERYLRYQQGEVWDAIGQRWIAAKK